MLYRKRKADFGVNEVSRNHILNHIFLSVHIGVDKIKSYYYECKFSCKFTGTVNSHEHCYLQITHHTHEICKSDKTFFRLETM